MHPSARATINISLYIMGPGMHVQGNVEDSLDGNTKATPVDESVEGNVEGNAERSVEANAEGSVEGKRHRQLEGGVGGSARSQRRRQHQERWHII